LASTRIAALSTVRVLLRSARPRTAARENFRHFLRSESASGADPDHSTENRKQVLNAVAHFSGELYVAASGRLGPPAKNTAAGKNDRINCPIVFNNGQTGRPVNLHPCHSASLGQRSTRDVDHYQTEAALLYL
jgi:hypothetical protein